MKVTMNPSTNLQRLSLNDAAPYFGLTPNGLRAKAKRGEVEYERDNSGKLWVFIDPASMKPSVKDEMKPSVKGDSLQVEALEGHIETLKNRILKLESEQVELQAKAADAVRFEGEVSRLVERIEATRLDHAAERDRLAGEIEALRSEVEDQRAMRHAAEIRAAEGLLARLGRLIARKG